MELKLYEKANCVQCRATDRKLKKTLGNVVYNELVNKISLDDNSEAVEHLKKLGFQSAPVIEVFDSKEDNEPRETWSGFRPERIVALGKIALKSAS